MTPAARIQAAIELIDLILASDAPADASVAAYLRERRYIGSGDRRELVERTYAVLRRRAALGWWVERGGAGLAPTGRTLMIAALALIDGWDADRIAGSFDGGRYRPAPLSREERAFARALEGGAIEHPEQPRAVRLEYPEWLEPKLAQAFGVRLETEMAALMAEAPLDLRANLIKATRGPARDALAESGLQAEETQLSPWGLRLNGRVALGNVPAFQAGLVEVQDEGSQVVALLTEAKPGMRVCDFCAGAGGKTLALAAMMQNKGQITACDVLPGRLDRSAVRLKRAGVHNVERVPLEHERDPWVKKHKARFDRVLVDAPCTGIGAWRRNPDAKWRLAPERLAELARLQGRILDSAARLVKPGGRLVYATCSLLPEENEAQVAAFLGAHPDFAQISVAELWAALLPETPAPTEGPALTLTPARHGTDGFFLAVLEREGA
ncbi:MAG: putative tRNA and rRNA cytosine-C5-methylase [Rhodospirillales bacterium]|nr:putative tRNA and rRNA cytosine-C5-methylase [Rhodospirillales bacterium]